MEELDIRTSSLRLESQGRILKQKRLEDGLSRPRLEEYIILMTFVACFQLKVLDLRQVRHVRTIVLYIQYI